MKHLKLLLLTIALVLFSEVTMAEDVYVVLDVGQGNAPKACEGLPSTMSCSNTTTALRAGLGVQVNKDVGFEVQYINFGKVTASGTYLGSPATANLTATGFEASIVGAIPLTPSVALMGKVGLAMIKGNATATVGGSSVSTSADNTNLAYGVGVRFNANDKIAIRLMYENYGDVKTSSTDTGGPVSIVSAGVQIGF